MRLNRYLKGRNIHTSLLIQNEEKNDELSQMIDDSMKWEAKAKQNEDLLALLSGIDEQQIEKV